MRHSSGKREDRKEVSKKVKKATRKENRSRSISTASSPDSEESGEMKTDKLVRQMVSSLGGEVNFLTLVGNISPQPQNYLRKQVLHPGQLFLRWATKLVASFGEICVKNSNDQPWASV